MSKVLISKKVKALYQAVALAAAVAAPVAYYAGYQSGAKASGDIMFADRKAPAQSPVTTENKKMTEKEVAELVKSWLPGMSVSENGIIYHDRVGLFQFMLGSGIFYLNEDGSAILKGEVFDTAMLNHDPERANLTEQFERALAFSRRQSDSFTELSEKVNVSTVKGVQDVLTSIKEEGIVTFLSEGVSKDTFYVFFDVSCPECKKFTPEIGDLTKLGYTVKVVLVSRKGVNNQAYKNSAQLACQANAPAELLNYMRIGFSGFSKRCEADLAMNMDAAAVLGIRGTPSIIRLSDAKLFEGLHYAKELEN